MKKKIKRSIENNLNTHAQVNWSTCLETALKNQVFNYNQDELLKDDGELARVRKLWR